MNILFYIDFPFKLNTGGVQRSTHKMAQLFERKGHQCVILNRDIGEESKLVDGLEVLSICNMEDSLEEQRYKDYLSQYNIDVVINQMGSDLRVTNFLYKNKGARVKLVSTLRMNPKNFADNLKDILKVELQKKNVVFFNTGLLRQFVLIYHRIKQALILSSIIKKSDYFVLLNKNFIPELKYFGIDTRKNAQKLKAIPNLFSPVKSDVSKKQNIILYVGRLSRNQKRTDLLMKIWKDLHVQLSDWEFLVVGDGEDKSWMKAYAERHKLERIKFLGSQDPELYYRKAKILSFTSAYEGFGNVLVEAQQHGVVPVMFNSYSAAPEIVVDNTSGFQIKPFDCVEYSKKTSLLAIDVELWKNLANGAELQAKKFEEEEVYKLWEELLTPLQVR